MDNSALVLGGLTIANMVATAGIYTNLNNKIIEKNVVVAGSDPRISGMQKDFDIITQRLNAYDKILVKIMERLDENAKPPSENSTPMRVSSQRKRGEITDPFSRKPVFSDDNDEDFSYLN